MLNPLNSSIFTLGLYRIQEDFQLSFTIVFWLITSFYLTSAAAQLVKGKFWDVISRKKTFLFGMAYVTVSALGAPLSTIFFKLLVMQLIQSIGSSTIYPSGIALIHDHITKERQASALAVLSIFSSDQRLGVSSLYVSIAPLSFRGTFHLSSFVLF
ncbi:MFS transporter [Neobacillus mesonae]|uniref:MFS transporter n=1 Tax=Neobacillus mesonae TaxID=1193713 RepID=UPI00203BC7D4|nr:MFS transporter [Neobacillus mesonae]MCM3566914.1 MFS transporter [Neobacillus mesonae]